MDLKEKMSVSSLSDSIAHPASSFQGFISYFKSVGNTVNNDIVSNTCPTQRCESVSSRRNVESDSAVKNRQILSLNPKSHS